MSTFGSIFSFAQVEQWVLDLARLRFTTYLAEAERQHGEPPRKFAPLKSFITANEWNSWPEQHLPCLLVIDTGMGDSPMRDGSGVWKARRLYGASIITQAPTREDVRWAVGMYGAAFRTMMLQNQDLGHPEHIGGLDWTDERPAPVPSQDSRNLGAQVAMFYVDVKNIADEGGTPPRDWPEPDDYNPGGEGELPYEEPGDHPVVQPLAEGESRYTIRTRSAQ